MKVINNNELFLTDDGYYEYQDQPFSGLARDFSADGALVSEIQYANGLQEGTARYWYPSGELLGEEHFLRNGQHGPSREWYRDGKLKRETVFEYSIRTQEKIWDENGKLIRDFVLTEGHPLFKSLELSRKLYGRAGN